jgi:uncharacterized protein YlxP (DUF503 family)
VTSRSTKVQTVTVKFLIYEGSALPTHGTLLDTKSISFSLSPGQTYNASVGHTTTAGTIDRRDVGVQIMVNSNVVAEDEWDDVFYVTAGGGEEIVFDLSQPTATPSQVSPGATVTITCPVTSRSAKVKTVTAKFLIYEGSALPTHGTLLDTKSVSFSISPGQTYNASVSHTAGAGTIDRRDVGVQIILNSNVVAEDEWDDVFYVTSGGGMASLNASYSNGVVSYSFLGFQPNATMTLTVVETGGYVTKTANSNGAGNGTFNDNDPAGTYTLRATDSYGHSATATFTIAAVGISFKVSIWGVPSDFGSYSYWWAYYLDPGIDDFVSCGKWYKSSEKIPFSNVQPGGYLAVFLSKDSTGSVVSGQYTSPTLQAVNGGSYTYDVQTGVIYG